MLKTLKFWLENARWVALPQSLMPALTAVVLASGEADFSVAGAIPAVIGVCAAHLSLNLFDDYFDYKKNKPGIRDTLARAGFRARIGKCAYIVSGEATTRQLLAASLAFGSVAGLCGVVIFAYRGTPVLWIVLITVILGLFYSAEPLRLSYRGMGELTIGLIFGPLLVTGVFLSASGAFDWSAVLIGAALGFFVINILYTHSSLDLDADRSVGKRTLAGLVPTPEGRFRISFILILVPYVIILTGILGGLLSAWHLLSLLTLPLAAALVRSMLAFCRAPGRSAVRRPWYGPMPQWEEIVRDGIDWFMLRWYLARNLLAAFCVLTMLAALLTV